jgi:hypothetical protein
MIYMSGCAERKECRIHATPLKSAKPDIFGQRLLIILCYISESNTVRAMSSKTKQGNVFGGKSQAGLYATF